MDYMRMDTLSQIILRYNKQICNTKNSAEHNITTH